MKKAKKVIETRRSNMIRDCFRRITTVLPDLLICTKRPPKIMLLPYDTLELQDEQMDHLGTHKTGFIRVA